MATFNRLRLIFFCLILALLPAGAIPSWADPPRYIILCIGDGMGFEQVRAGGMFTYGDAGTLIFESFPYQGQVTTHSADEAITDSAAAATAMACGVKVNNGVVSRQIPGSGEDLETLLEWFRDRGRSTGLVTTTAMVDGTPAAFGSHADFRDDFTVIADGYLNLTRPTVLMGGGGTIDPVAGQLAGYTYVSSRFALQAIDLDATASLLGLFGATHLPYELTGLGALPHLSEMTAAALDVLDNNPRGFFLMVEGGRIDHACHDNRIDQMVREMREFDATIRVILDWAAGRNDVLVVVTADHETGGLTVTANNGQGVDPEVTWSSGDHTAANVPLYAWGLNAELALTVTDNTGFPAFLKADVIVSSVPASTVHAR